jgi:hypothetical protein
MLPDSTTDILRNPVQSTEEEGNKKALDVNQRSEQKKKVKYTVSSSSPRCHLSFHWSSLFPNNAPHTPVNKEML